MAKTQYFKSKIKVGVGNNFLQKPILMGKHLLTEVVLFKPIFRIILFYIKVKFYSITCSIKWF
tara:strand:+ start:217914 stop:218102 length:189 start_codon:yes stop_codon:yes gene_type:complete